MRFDHLSPTRITFGNGTLDAAGPAAATLGTRSLVICGQSARRSGTLDRLLAALRASDVEAVVHDGVTPNPSSDDVDAVIAIARRSHADVLIGLGGGSSLDTAKAAAACIDHDSVRELIGTTLPEDARGRPVLAIPTTTGSGAEVTKGAILTDPVRRLKSGVRGSAIFPRIAIVDPQLARTLPPEVAAETGFDAFTHALESYIARRATPITDALAEKALTLLAPALRALARGIWDDKQREALALAALLGGINVANASTCLPHRMQQAMGSVARVRVSHARGLALLYPAWLDRVQPFASARLATAAGALGARDIRAAIAELLDGLGLGGTLRDRGFVDEDVVTFTRGLTGNIDNDPIPGADAQVARDLFRRALPTV
jgi:alcohol dehydrogenase class IV